MSLFGPTNLKVWQDFSREIGAAYFAGGSWNLGEIQGHGGVQAHVGPWTITLSSYLERRWYTHTQIHAPYVNADGFQFSIKRPSFFSNLGMALGLVQSIPVGFPEFDKAFVISGHGAKRVRTLFADAKFRELLQAQPKFQLEVKGSRGLGCLTPPSALPPFPKDVDVLFFQVDEAIADTERLKGLLDLFVATLERLCHIGSALREPPGVQLEGCLCPALTLGT